MRDQHKLYWTEEDRIRSCIFRQEAGMKRFKTWLRTLGELGGIAVADGIRYIGQSKQVMDRESQV